MQRGFQFTFWLSVVAVAAIIFWMRDPPPQAGPGNGTQLVVYCAAGIRQPFEEVHADYTRAYQVTFQTKFAGSGELLGDIKLGAPDLFLAADRKYLADAQQMGLVREIIPLAQQYPVILVAKGNPRGIRNLADLADGKIQLSLANPKIAAIGKVVQRGLQGLTSWDALWERRTVERATVEQVANDVKLGAVDAGIVWNATLNHFPGLDAVEVPELSALVSEICIGVTVASKQPSRALHFARFLAAADRGLVHFANRGYAVSGGDAWSERPELSFYAGGLNRLAVEPIIARFAEREGVQVTTVYNGCGTLVGQMKAGARPDVYFACDRTFMDIVRRPGDLVLFGEPQDVSQTDMVIITPASNPKNIHSLADLAADGVKLSLCDPQKSALGALTDQLLDKYRLRERVRANVQSTSGTADYCVQAVVVGGLDAAIVYRANVALQSDKLQVMAIDDPAATAIQPIAVGRESKFPHLSQRLVDAVVSAESQAEFTGRGFKWLPKSPPRQPAQGKE